MKKNKKLYSYRTISPLDGPYVEWMGKKMLDFSSTDYLGLGQHPDVKKNAIRYVLKYGVGSIAGQIAAVQRQLEEKLARYLGREQANLYNSEAEVKEALSSLGCSATDDTETFGLLGQKGFGENAHVAGIEVLSGSFSKGGGCPVSYIATSLELQRQLPRFGTICPALLGALDAILNFLPDMESERTKVQQNGSWLSSHLAEAGLSFTAYSPASFAVCFENPQAKEKALQLFAEGEIFVGDLSETEILLSTTALHTPDDLDQVGIALKKLAAADFALAMQSLTDTPQK